MADTVSLLSPSLIVIGGQLARAEEVFLAGIRELVYQRPLQLATRSLDVTTSRLDKHAGVTGLADEIFTRRTGPEGHVPSRPVEKAT